MDVRYGVARSPGARSRAGAVLAGSVLALALLPTLAAIVGAPGFLTQDGPAHVYNAGVAAAILGAGDTGPPQSTDFVLRPVLVPNLAGHVLAAALSSALGPEATGRALAVLTLAAVAGAVLVLRARLAAGGGRALAALAPVAALLALNLPWLLGFWSFLAGTALFALTLAATVAPPAAGPLTRPGLRRAAGLGGLLALGWFCHPVSLGATLLAIGVTAGRARGEERRARAGELALASLPVVGLSIPYLLAMRGAGAIRPSWDSLWDAGSLTLAKHFRFVSAWTLARPDRGGESNGLLFLGLIAVLLARRQWPGRRTTPPGGERPGAGRRGALSAGCLLVAGGLVGPDALGAEHGDYLPQRLLLLGAVALLGAVEIDLRSGYVWAGVGLAVLGLGVQSLEVARYGRISRAIARDVERARRRLPRGTRLAGLVLADPSAGFRASPALHADALLAAEADAVLWSDYEAARYYFPVRYRDGVPHPPPLAFEWLSRSRGASDRASRFAALLDGHGPEIDALFVVGSDPEMDAVAASYGYREAEAGAVARLLVRSAAAHRP